MTDGFDSIQVVLEDGPPRAEPQVCHRCGATGTMLHAEFDIRGDVLRHHCDDCCVPLSIQRMSKAAS